MNEMNEMNEMNGLATCISTYVPAHTLPVHSLRMNGVFHKARRLKPAN